MNKKLYRLKMILQKKEIRPTYQRLKIFEYLHQSKEHPTVEMIYNNMVKKIPTISKATIYNTINLLVEKGLIVPLAIPDSDTRFESNVGWHHHFLCERCGKIIDLDIKCEYFEKREIQGHRIKELHGYFKGICRKCLESKELV